jgi:O-antigen/teichoic acid export membrane protein
VLQTVSGGSEFKRNLITLMSGVAVAQAIPILCSPVLSRLFTPDSFGLFANFMAVSAFLGVAVSGKYESAIILPKRDQEAINVLSLSCVISVLFTLIFCLIFLCFGNLITGMLKVHQLSPYMWLIPITALLSAIFLIFNEWCIRKKKFVVLGKNKISNTSGIAGTSILLGLAKLQSGLILGQIVGQIFSATSAIVRVLKHDKHLFAYVTKKKMIYFAKKYINFAKFIIPGQFLNTLGGQLPVFLLSGQFGFYQTGLYLMCDRVLGVPVTFFGNTFKDVFKQRATQDYQTYGNCIDIFKKTVFSLTKIAILPFIVLFITAPYLFEYVLGREWYDAGIYARYLCVMYMLSFISVPTGWMIIIAEKPYWEVIWQTFYLVLTIIPLCIGVILKDIKMTLILFCIGRSFAYLILVFICYKLAKGNNQ